MILLLCVIFLFFYRLLFTIKFFNEFQNMIIIFQNINKFNMYTYSFNYLNLNMYMYEYVYVWIYTCAIFLFQWRIHKRRIAMLTDSSRKTYSWNRLCYAHNSQNIITNIYMEEEEKILVVVSMTIKCTPQLHDMDHSFLGN